MERKLTRFDGLLSEVVVVQAQPEPNPRASAPGRCHWYVRVLFRVIEKLEAMKSPRRTLAPSEVAFAQSEESFARARRYPACPS